MFVMKRMKIWYKLTLVCFSMAISGCALLSVSFSVLGIFREKIRRCRYYLLIAGNLLFIIWMILE